MINALFLRFTNLLTILTALFLNAVSKVLHSSNYQIHTVNLYQLIVHFLVKPESAEKLVNKCSGVKSKLQYVHLKCRGVEGQVPRNCTSVLHLIDCQLLLTQFLFSLVKTVRIWVHAQNCMSCQVKWIQKASFKEFNKKWAQLNLLKQNGTKNGTQERVVCLRHNKLSKLSWAETVPRQHNAERTSTKWKTILGRKKE